MIEKTFNKKLKKIFLKKKAKKFVQKFRSRYREIVKTKIFHSKLWRQWPCLRQIKIHPTSYL